MSTTDLLAIASDFTKEPLPEQAQVKPVSLDFLEGLRGLAALYVVLAHCQKQVQDTLSISLLSYTRWMQYGHWAVDVFIVLSGYCLMLPVARSTDGHLRGGVTAYFVRRARRIIPSYYAAIIFSLLLLIAAHGLGRHGYGGDTQYRDNFSAAVLVSHALLIHNLSLNWIYAINPALWSVATEWQIYFIFPALLLPVWRRFGGAAAVVIGFIVGMLPHFLLPKSSNFDWVYPWYIGLFALGMAGANIGFSTRPFEVLLRRAPWGWFTLILFGGIGLLSATHSKLIDNAYIIDFFIGLLTVSAIVNSTRYSMGAQDISRPWLLRVCSTKASLLLGTFSFSLYLIHVPIIQFVFKVLSLAHFSSVLTFGLLILTGLPISLLAAYLFSIPFERPFVSSRRRQAK